MVCVFAELLNDEAQDFKGLESIIYIVSFSFGNVVNYEYRSV